MCHNYASLSKYNFSFGTSRNVMVIKFSLQDIVSEFNSQWGLYTIWLYDTTKQTLLNNLSYTGIYI